MEDLGGDWVLEEESLELYVTVGTDQSIPDPFSTLGLTEAEGSITATASDFEAELNYLMIGIFDDDDSDCNINCEGEYYDYMDEGIDVSDEYCECCHEDYPIDEICEDDSSRSRSCLNLELYDSECDGWNGAYWYVTDADGDTVDYDMEAMAEGCDEQTEICLDEGDYTFYCVGAGDSSDAEISWILYNEDWEEIASGGAGDMASFYVDEDGDDDGDDWDPEAIITNLNLIEFFMAMFGMDLDSLGVENPMLVGVTSTQTESGDIVLDEVFAMFLGEDDMDGAIADSTEAVANTSIDTTTGSTTFNNLALYDSTGAAVLTLSGTIGPSWIDFVAGEETFFPFLEGIDDMFDEDDEDLFMSFYEDSTGMEIEVGYGDYYYYYYGTWADTSYFTWEATEDSIVIYEESDYYDVDTTELAYFIEDDTLTMEALFDLCEVEDSFEECIEFASEEIAGLAGLYELEDIESLRIYFGRILTPGSYTSVDHGDGSIPEAFNLYANYPNPFNPMTTIRFDVGQNTGHNTILRIYDITGRVVATLVNGQLQTGTYEAQWDARGFASGIYFSELVSGTNRQTQKMVLLK